MKSQMVLFSAVVSSQKGIKLVIWLVVDWYVGLRVESQNGRCLELCHIVGHVFIIDSRGETGSGYV
jgi:hypothetical protein